MKGDFRIGKWLVHDQLCRLEHGDESIHVKPRIMRLLVYLANNAGKVISKENLVKDLWSGAHVSDNALMNSISELRKLLGDDAREPLFIDTIPKRGYRLIAPVVVEPTAEPAPRPAGRQPLRLAVMPLAYLCHDASQGYLADVLTDMLITALARHRALWVTSRTSVTYYKRTQSLLPEIARQLNADLVLEGAIVESQQSVQAMVRLYNTEDENLWAETFEQERLDTLTTFQLLTQQISRQIVEHHL